MKTLFVDESGDMGDRGRYFVVAMFCPEQNKKFVNIIKHFCAANNLEEVKSSKLSFPKKQESFNKICAFNDYAVSYVVADKDKIDNKKLFSDKNLFYNYLFSFLIKKTIQNSQEDISIMMDNHSLKVKSINSLADYIRLKAYTQWNFKRDLFVTYVDSRNSKIVQAADLVANAIYARYTYGSMHFYRMINIIESIRFPCQKFELSR